MTSDDDDDDDDNNNRLLLPVFSNNYQTTPPPARDSTAACTRTRIWSITCIIIVMHENGKSERTVLYSRTASQTNDCVSDWN